MEKTVKPPTPDPRPRSANSNCTCSFCLYVFQLRDLSEKDARKFRRHLQEKHGLKLGEPSP